MQVSPIGMLTWIHIEMILEWLSSNKQMKKLYMNFMVLQVFMEDSRDKEEN